MIRILIHHDSPLNAPSVGVIDATVSQFVLVLLLPRSYLKSACNFCVCAFGDILSIVIMQGNVGTYV